MSKFYEGEIWLGAYHRGGLFISPTDLIGHALSAFRAGARELNCDESRGLTALVRELHVYFTFDSADLPGNSLNREETRAEVELLLAAKFKRPIEFVDELPKMASLNREVS